MVLPIKMASCINARGSSPSIIVARGSTARVALRTVAIFLDVGACSRESFDDSADV